MIQYPKIYNVFTRDETTRKLTGVASQPEYAYMQDLRWLWTEKVDGTNVRVIVTPNAVEFRGKTDRAQMPLPLHDLLSVKFAPTIHALCFPDEDVVTLYGEGYGRKIQEPAGSTYNPRGVWFGQSCWARRSVVEEIGRALDVPVVPVVGRGTLAQAVDFVTRGFQSQMSEGRILEAEGIVARPDCDAEMTCGNRRVMVKIKTRDLR